MKIPAILLQFLRFTGPAIITSLLIAGFTPACPSQAASLNPADYFAYTYSISMSKYYVQRGEIFYATVTGEATCIKDAPLHPTEAYIKGRIIARHIETQTQYTLNSSYSLTISPVPSVEGDSITASQELPLYFPWDSLAGEYEISGELIEARFKAGGLWFDATGYFPQTQSMGNAFYAIPEPVPPSPQPPPATTTSDETPVQPPPAPTTSLPEPEPGPEPEPSPEPEPVPEPPPEPEPEPADPSIPVIPQGSTRITGYLNQEGQLGTVLVMSSPDEMAALEFEPGCSMAGSDGDALVWLMLASKTEIPDPADLNRQAGSAYEILPGFSRFNPFGTLSIRYHDSQVPPGMNEAELMMARWDNPGQEWIIIDSCLVDTDSNTVRTTISEAGIYAILAPVSPPEFSVTNLKVSPAEAARGEMVTIQCTVTNTGNIAGYYELVLKLNGQLQQVKRISLGGGGSQVVNFGIVRYSTGIIDVNINGAVASYRITSDEYSSTYTPSTKPSSGPDEPVFYWIWVVYVLNAVLMIVIIFLGRKWIGRQLLRLRTKLLNRDQH